MVKLTFPVAKIAEVARGVGQAVAGLVRDTRERAEQLRRRHTELGDAAGPLQFIIGFIGVVTGTENCEPILPS
jgi:hypothetical protein